MPSGVYERKGISKIRSDKGVSKGSQSNYPVYWEHGIHEDVFVNGHQKNKLPPLDVLNWLFRYDQIEGKLFKIRGSSGRLWNPEKEITTVGSAGYLSVNVTDSSGLNKKLAVHQIIYYMHTGVEPLQVVDHYDGQPSNNRFENLRLTNESGNSRNAKMKSNNTSGVTGVYWYKPYSKWRALVYDNAGKLKHLGYFDEIHEATNVVQNFRSNPELGYSVRHGVST